MKNPIPWMFGSVLLLLATTVLWLGISYHAPLPGITGPAVLQVRSGSSLTRVASDLQARGLLDRPRVLRLMGHLNGGAHAIKAGEYQLQPGISAAQLLQLLIEGKTIQYRVTLVEGWTLQQVLQALAALDTLEHTLSDISPAELANLLALTTSNPEGMVHPDTYFFTRGTSDLDILRRARQRQQQILQQLWEKRADALPYQSPYEALVMASIIEKESSLRSEKGHIAGVFLRRLANNMRLQSDPTVIYGLGADYRGNLTRRHLQTTTAYNTYRIDGLPPTPIALPGTDSIAASLHPLPSDFLYFVATGDGGHKFSATLEEHNAFVRQYQRSSLVTATGNR